MQEVREGTIEYKPAEDADKVRNRVEREGEDQAIPQ